MTENMVNAKNVFADIFYILMNQSFCAIMPANQAHIKLKYVLRYFGAFSKHK